MVVTKIHRVLEFQQFPWLKSYINFNTEKRKAATSDFEKDFFKLMSNSVYGKFMESIRKRVNVELVNNQKRIKKALAKPTVKNFTYVNDDLVMVQFTKKAIVQNKPMYTGFVVLELSKVLMYDFHYNHIQGQYGSDRARLLFTKFNTCFPSHLLSMPILNRLLHLPENTYPVAFVLCQYQNFPSMITKFTRILDPMLYRNF